MAKFNEIIDGIKRSIALILADKAVGYSKADLTKLLAAVRKAEKALSWMVEGKQTQEA
ncbi:MAG: hypothetical protein KAJ18_03460 [Candidatus Omnitrophica bacterium]|nr:hypothetical protein [Candidatus Omnitrophota bacterium]